MLFDADDGHIDNGKSDFYNSSLPARAPIYYADDSTQCVQGPKQLIALHQADAVNVFPPRGVSPEYDGGRLAESDMLGTSVPTTTTSTSPQIIYRVLQSSINRVGGIYTLCTSSIIQ